MATITRYAVAAATATIISLGTTGSGMSSLASAPQPMATTARITPRCQESFGGGEGVAMISGSRLRHWSYAMAAVYGECRKMSSDLSLQWVGTTNFLCGEKSPGG